MNSKKLCNCPGYGGTKSNVFSISDQLNAFWYNQALCRQCQHDDCVWKSPYWRVFSFSINSTQQQSFTSVTQEKLGHFYVQFAIQIREHTVPHNHCKSFIPLFGSKMRNFTKKGFWKFPLFGVKSVENRSVFIDNFIDKIDSSYFLEFLLTKTRLYLKNWGQVAIKR